jgi:preprotein translocase subunit SecG
MSTVLLVIHLLIAASLVGLVLLQRSEGGALGMGGGTGSLISGRGAADMLAKMTMVAGGLFLLTSISLTVIAGFSQRELENSIVLNRPASQRSVAAPPPARRAAPAPAPAAPAAELTPASAPAADAAAGVAPSPSGALERAGPIERTATPPAAQPTPQNAAPVRSAAAAPPARAPRARAVAPPRAPAPQLAKLRREWPTPPPPAATPPAESIQTEPAPAPVRRRAGPDQ